MKKSILAGVLIMMFIMAMQAFAGIVQLPQTGQASCWNASGDVISCDGTGQDGDLQKGVAWPDPRFSENGNQTVTDNLTGLLWTKDANLMVTRDPGFDNDGTMNDGAVSWQHALDYVKKLNQENYLGYNDWRLPNPKELESLVNRQQSDNGYWLNSQGFSNVRSGFYWSSSTDAGSANFAWLVHMCHGNVYIQKTPYGYYVWPVRGGQSGSFGSSVISLPRTGQTTCWDTNGAVISCAGTGRDGEKQAGVAWPEPRFADNGDQTVTDNLTGLIWTKDANLMVTRDSDFYNDSIGHDGTVTWQRALDYIKKLNQENYLGHNDWRLPNLKELESLVNRQQSDNGYWLNGQGFSNVQSDYYCYYWSSSTHAAFTDYACVVDVGSGYVDSYSKAEYGYVWPVRGGQSGPLGSLYGHFTGAGIWQWTGSGWTQLTPDNPETIVAAGTNLYGKFGNGIWQWNGSSWNKLTPDRPAAMVASGSNLYGNFTGNGIWQWGGSSWTQLTPDNPESMVAADSNLYGKFGNGIWQWTGSGWTKLTSDRPADMVAAGSNLYGSFTGSGIWQWNGSGWSLLTPDIPEAMAAAGSNLYGKFGNGIWQWNGSGWTKLTPDKPASMAAAGSNLYGSFTGNGIWQWNGSGWTQLTPDNPAIMAVGD